MFTRQVKVKNGEKYFEKFIYQEELPTLTGNNKLPAILPPGPCLIPLFGGECTAKFVRDGHQRAQSRADKKSIEKNRGPKDVPFLENSKKIHRLKKNVIIENLVLHV